MLTWQDIEPVVMKSDISQRKISLSFKRYNHSACKPASGEGRHIYVFINTFSNGIFSIKLLYIAFYFESVY